MWRSLNFQYYKYKENKKGENEYKYSLVNEKEEVIEVIKNKDGSGEVYYQGHFENMDDTNALSEGADFEKIGSVCSQ